MIKKLWRFLFPVKTVFVTQKTNCYTPKGYVAYFFNKGKDIVVAQNEGKARRQYNLIQRARLRPTSIPIVKEKTNEKHNDSTPTT
ncbi:MAG: hypothetical protein R2831_10905 [Chitinophagaceae bacterium]